MAALFKLISALRVIVKPFASARRINNGVGPYGEGNPSGWYH